jgi:sortase (surface protein transpeptidase)
VRPRLRLGLCGATVAAALLLSGCGAAAQGDDAPARASGSTAPERDGSGLDAAQDFHSDRAFKGTPAPTRITIPSIGVSSSLLKLGKAKDGTVEVPGPWGVAGWYAKGPRPGDPGSAVIMGHVDSKSGPAVFYRLRELRPGDEIEVSRADGSRVTFVVDRTAQYLKKRFPTDDVYYPTLKPSLRLVTCGGEFDYSLRHYKSNIIVFASMKQ